MICHWSPFWTETGVAGTSTSNAPKDISALFCLSKNFNYHQIFVKFLQVRLKKWNFFVTYKTLTNSKSIPILFLPTVILFVEICNLEFQVKMDSSNLLRWQFLLGSWCWTFINFVKFSVQMDFSDISIQLFLQLVRLLC